MIREGAQPASRLRECQESRGSRTITPWGVVTRTGYNPIYPRVYLSLNALPPSPPCWLGRALTTGTRSVFILSRIEKWTASSFSESVRTRARFVPMCEPDAMMDSRRRLDAALLFYLFFFFFLKKTEDVQTRDADTKRSGQGTSVPEKHAKIGLYPQITISRR